MQMWEFINGNLKRWPFTAPTNDLPPSDPSSPEGNASCNAPRLKIGATRPLHAYCRSFARLVGTLCSDS